MTSKKKNIVLIQPRCGKYDLFIVDMPLGLLYISRLLLAKGYQVSIVDQRIENPFTRLDALLNEDTLWVGLTAMTGEPIQHALRLARYVKKKCKAPIVWGGIHPTILPEQTLRNPFVDYVIRGKGERSAIFLSEYLQNQLDIKDVPGLTYWNKHEIHHNPEDNEDLWDEMPMVNYGLIDIEKYFRVGFAKNIFSIMTSRNCPYRCTFCYNSALKRPKAWLPDSLPYTKRHLDLIIDRFQPDYLSFIDDDFFIDINRARAILEYLEGKAPQMMIGFRGARVSDLLKLDNAFFDLMERVKVRHLNIGVESGSPWILKKINKGITPAMTVELNRRLARKPFLTPLYNFFSGIPTETEDDIRLSTRLILKLTADNPNCQISGYHQYTPYPGNKLFDEAVKFGFPEPTTLAEWGDKRLEDNADNCPWITASQKRLLNTIYCMVYFVDNKYDQYIASHKRFFRLLLPLVRGYKIIAKIRLKHHFTFFPIEIWAKELFYRLFDKEKGV